MQHEQTKRVRAAGAPRRAPALALAGVTLVLAPLTLFAFMLWLTDGAPLRPPGAAAAPELGALPIAQAR